MNYRIIGAIAAIAFIVAGGTWLTVVDKKNVENIKPESPSSKEEYTYKGSVTLYGEEYDVINSHFKKPESRIIQPVTFVIAIDKAKEGSSEKVVRVRTQKGKPQ